MIVYVVAAADETCEMPLGDQHGQAVQVFLGACIVCAH